MGPDTKHRYRPLTVPVGRTNKKRDSQQMMFTGEILDIIILKMVVSNIFSFTQKTWGDDPI